MIKLGLRTIPPITFTFLRFFISTLVILPLFLREKPKFKAIIEIAKPVILATVNIFLFYYALGFTSANVVQITYTTIPIIVVFLSYFILKEKVNANKFFGVILGFVGAMILFLFNSVKGYSMTSNAIGITLTFSGGVIYSLYLIYSKRLQKKYSPISITAVFSFVTMVVSFLLSFTEVDSISSIFNQNSLSMIWLLLYISVLGTTGYYILTQYAIKHGSPTISSSTLFIQPVFTLIWAGFLLGEKVTPSFYISAILIILGAWLVTKES